MSTSEKVQSYRIEGGDNLGAIAEHFGLAGPYALYFAPGNQMLREQYPDPTRIPVGVELHIPADDSEQRTGLLNHLRRMELAREEIGRIRAVQLAAFGKISLDGGAPRERIVALVACTIKQTLYGIQALKFSDSGMSCANHALATAGLTQRPVLTPAIALDALNQCHLASAGVYWLIDNQSAMAWCGVNAPAFWGRSVITAVASPDIDRLDVQLVVDGITCQYQLASDRVMQSVATVICELISEINRLDRKRESCPVSR